MKTLTLFAVAATAFGLAACSEKTQNEGAEAASAIGNDIEATTENAISDLNAAAADATSSVDNALDDAGNTAEKAGDDAENAGDDVANGADNVAGR